MGIKKSLALVPLKAEKKKHFRVREIEKVEYK